MDVIGIAVIGGTDCEYRVEFRWLKCRELEAIKSAPGDSHHPTRPVHQGWAAIQLRDGQTVVQLLLHIFVGEHALRSPLPRISTRTPA